MPSSAARTLPKLLFSATILLLIGAALVLDIHLSIFKAQAVALPLEHALPTMPVHTKIAQVPILIIEERVQPGRQRRLQEPGVHRERLEARRALALLRLTRLLRCPELILKDALPFLALLRGVHLVLVRVLVQLRQEGVVVEEVRIGQPGEGDLLPGLQVLALLQQELLLHAVAHLVQDVTVLAAALGRELFVATEVGGEDLQGGRRLGGVARALDVLQQVLELCLDVLELVLEGRILQVLLEVGASLVLGAPAVDDHPVVLAMARIDE